MAENINAANPFSSGNSTWNWESPRVAEKVLTAAGADGAFSFKVSGLPRRCKITGMLQAATIAALRTLEGVIEAYAEARTELAWEDDEGRSGSNLVVESYNRVGPRLYHSGGVKVWQYFVVMVRDNVP